MFESVGKVSAMSDSSTAPVAFGMVACGLCHLYEARWVHALDMRLAEFRVYGKGHVWGSPLTVCDRCHEMLLSKDADGLVAIDPRAADLEGQDLREQLGNGVASLVAADLGGHDINEDRPGGYLELVRQGFIPLENVTGALHLALAWPEEHRRSLPATDTDDISYLPEGKNWFIRSPWPSIPLEPLFRLVIRTVDETLDRQAGHRFDEQLVNAEVRNLLSGSQREIEAKLAR